MLCSELHLDVFTGVLRVGRITFARRRKALVRRLHFGDRDREAEGLDGGVFTDDDRAQQIPDQPEDWAHAVVFARPCGRWWLDAWVAKRSFLRGVLVLTCVVEILFIYLFIYIFFRYIVKLAVLQTALWSCTRMMPGGTCALRAMIRLQAVYFLW